MAGPGKHGWQLAAGVRSFRLLLSSARPQPEAAVETSRFQVNLIGPEQTLPGVLSNSLKSEEQSLDDWKVFAQRWLWLLVWSVDWDIWCASEPTFAPNLRRRLDQSRARRPKGTEEYGS